MNKRSRDKKLAKNLRDPHAHIFYKFLSQYPVGKIQTRNEKIPDTFTKGANVPKIKRIDSIQRKCDFKWIQLN